MLGTLSQDRLLDGGHAGQIGGRPSWLEVAVQRVGHVPHTAGEHREVLVSQVGNAGQREGAERGAVVCPMPGDHRVALLVAVGQVVAARELEGRLHGLGAGTHEEHPVHVAGRHRGDHRRGLDGRRVGETPIGVERQLVHLLGRGGGQVGPTVAEVGAEKARESVEILVAVRVPDVATLAALDHDEVVRPPSVAPREVRYQMALSTLAATRHAVVPRPSVRQSTSSIRDYGTLASMSNRNRAVSKEGVFAAGLQHLHHRAVGMAPDPGGWRRWGSCRRPQRRSGASRR